MVANQDLPSEITASLPRNEMTKFLGECHCKKTSYVRPAVLDKVACEHP